MRRSWREYYYKMIVIIIIYKVNGIKSRTVVGETNKLTENALKRIEVLSAKGIHISNMSEI